ncbi:U3 small nucleolar RNA-interacting protein 2 [Anopheles ziemanni]|uniref:U3 small nucleolar RNA-interacting protein 2 n=1 Tax=Anopheles coustani TaxID=139045 RepID=UPI0026594DFD|nr:U3 small nucleolar RNA-interacting protein 2 [Anopheles coustani]XP_058171936.1 U3 small nucleolar RNA-interacting protein 2 [Anopheles ziemanni]
MSLFKVGRKQNEKVNLKRTKGAPKANIKPSKEAKVEDDNIDSDEELLKEQHKFRDVEDDMATLETTQDKRIRLAKQYLRHVQEQQQDREEYEDETELTRGMARSLKESYLSSTGKTYRPLAAKLTNFDLDNATTLHWKMQRLSPTCCTLSENNAALYVGCKSGWIVRWDLKSAKRTASFHVKNCNVKSLSVSHDMKYLAVADGTEEIKILDGTSLVQLNTLNGHSKAVNGVVFRKGTYQLYSCSADRTVKVWSLDEMVYIETLYGHQSEVSGIDALSIERIVTSGGMDQSLRVWKVAEETQLVYNALTEDFSAVKFVNTELFISGSIEGSLCLWSCAKKKPLHRIVLAHGEEDVGHPNWISSVGVLANSDVIASGSCDGFVRVWKLANKRRSIEPLLTIPVVGFINAIEFTSDGRFLIVAVGQEHRLGRWWTLRNAKNRTLVIPLSIDV